MHYKTQINLKHYAVKSYIFLTICLGIISVPFIGQLSVYYKNQRAAVAKAEETLALRRHVYAVMHGVGVHMTQPRKELLVDALVRVAGKVFETQESKEYFVTLIAIESRFNKDAKSSAGAMGLSQIMPKYAKEFSALCNLGELSDSDYTDTEMNLMLGACQFRELLRSTGGNVAAALVAYNSGRSSQSLRQLTAGASIENTETASYATRAFFLQQKVKKSTKAATYVASKEKENLNDNN